jgi:hypothetical protein
VAPPGADRCFKSRNLDEIRLNVSRFQLSAQAPVDNGLVREHRSDPGAESIVVTSPLPAHATSPPLASRTVRSGGASSPPEADSDFSFPENLQAMNLTYPNFGTLSTSLRFSTYSIST